MKIWSPFNFRSNEIRDNSTAALTPSTSTVPGISTLATQVETEARSVPDKVVTPADLANFALKSEAGLPTPSANNKILVTEALAWVLKDYKTLTSVICVSNTDGDDTYGDGKFQSPYKTIGQAYSVCGNNSLILVFPGTYSENLSITGGKTNVGLISIGSGINNHQVIVDGTTSISNSDLATYGIDFNTGSNTSTALSYAGNYKFSAFNCSFETGAGGAVPLVAVDGTYTSIISFKDCYGPNHGTGFVINGTSTALVDFNGCNTLAKLSVNGTYSVRAQNSSFGDIYHTAGNLYLRNCTATNFTSTANTDTLYVSNNSFRDQDTYTLGTFNKTGSCGYYFGVNEYDYASSTIVGTLLGSTLPAKVLWYDNSATMIAEDNVQDVLDRLLNNPVGGIDVYSAWLYDSSP